jgi:GNAT superfamily N-acetyltransferase
VHPADVEAIERATVAAVAPDEVAEIGGWLVAFDAGTVGRAKSAAPLSHDIGPDAIDEIAQAYRARGLTPCFRVADGDGLAGVREALTARGYRPEKPTCVKVADCAAVAALAEPSARLMDRPDAAWGDVFLGEGFDPVDGAHRVRLLTRSPDAVYGAVDLDGAAAAVGAVSLGCGWASLHGMRTRQDARRRGLAGTVIATLAGAALARGFPRMFLQVEEGNPARSLYRKAGFALVWRYRYWSEA